MKKNSKIYIAGHNGMVGSAIARNLTSLGYTNHVYTPYPPFDLTNQQVVADFFTREKPEYVFLAAAKLEVSCPIITTGPNFCMKTS